ncbi:MAG: hypothetical protein WBG43_08130 [Marinifilaceae bacterium]
MQLNKTHLKEYLRLLYVANNRVDKKNSTNSTSSSRWAKQFWASLLIGSFLVFMFSRMADFNLATALFFLVIMFTLIAEFLSEYAIILLDTKGNDILFHHPISSQTVFAGRLIYILAVALFSGLTIAFPYLIYVIVSKGVLVGLGFIISCVLTIISSISLALFLYVLLFKFCGAERLKNIINYVQIAMSMILIATYYLSIELFDLTDLSQLSFSYEWWSVFVPSYWFLSILDILGGVEIPVFAKLFPALAVILPCVLSVFSYKYLSKIFKTELIRFDHKEKKTEKIKSKFTLTNFYIKFFAVNKIERELFVLYKKLLSRDKNFKMAVYPAIAYSLVMPIIRIVKETSKAPLSESTDVSLFLFALYFSSIVFITSVFSFHIGDYGKLSDLYRVSPLKKKGLIMTSALKVLNYNFLLVPMLLCSVFIGYIWGFTYVFNVVTVFFIVNIICMLMLLIGTSRFPLSLAKGDSDKISMGVKMFAIIAFLSMVGVAHYYILFATYGLIIYTSLLAVVYLIIIRYLRVKTIK